VLTLLDCRYILLIECKMTDSLDLCYRWITCNDVTICNQLKLAGDACLVGFPHSSEARGRSIVTPGGHLNGLRWDKISHQGASISDT
jgi:hypothetical protein